MDKTILVEKTIEEGKNLIKELDEQDFNVVAAFWFYLTDVKTWRLVLATPFAKNNGPIKSYTLIQKALAKLGLTEIALNDISVVNPEDALVKLLGTAIKTGPGISGIRFTRNTINGVFIEDAYIYRLQR